jgi:hypothetical protein
VFGLSRLEIEACGLLLLVAAVLIWLGIHDAGVKREALAPVQAAVAAASAAQAASAARTVALQEGNLHVAHEEVAAQAVQIADLRGAVADAYRLRDAAVRRAADAASTAAASGGAARGDAAPDVVQWQRLYASALGARAEAESDAADLAATVAGLRTSGALCARDYDALK